MGSRDIEHTHKLNLWAGEEMSKSKRGAGTGQAEAQAVNDV